MLKMTKNLSNIILMFINFIILCIFCPIYDISFLAYFLYTDLNKIVEKKRGKRIGICERRNSHGRKNIPEMV